MTNSIMLSDNVPYKISQFFRTSNFDSLIFKNDSSLLNEILLDTKIKKDLKGKNFFYAFDYFFNIINQHYKNEYVFKNIIANRLIKGRHKLANVAYMNEFHVLNSICDVAIFNGTSTAYEIKTGLDNLDRISSQLTDYKKVFEKIFIVCDDSKIKILEQTLDKDVGIIRLTHRKQMSTIREASSNIENLSISALFKSLRNSEILDYMKKKYDYIPDISPKKTRNDCLNLFQKMDIIEAHNVFVNILRKRELKNEEKRSIEKLPFSLLALMLNIRPSLRRLKIISSRLENQIL
ncbi:sce7726 family protein [Snodgrassella alvi]|uniref:sce7726 family protein n=1 Tax=Snodgrassella alvi TaxID=1196083 RepID=UPI00351C007D